jgi:hypothetical protein
VLLLPQCLWRRLWFWTRFSTENVYVWCAWSPLIMYSARPIWTAAHLLSAVHAVCIQVSHESICEGTGIIAVQTPVRCCIPALLLSWYGTWHQVFRCVVCRSIQLGHA